VSAEQWASALSVAQESHGRPKSPEPKLMRPSMRTSRWNPFPLSNFSRSLRINLKQGLEDSLRNYTKIGLTTESSHSLRLPYSHICAVMDMRIKTSVPGRSVMRGTQGSRGLSIPHIGMNQPLASGLVVSNPLGT